MYRDLAALLPDTPRWVETRSLLLSGRCEVVGAGAKPSLPFVVVSSDLPLICIAGKADPHSIQEAIDKKGKFAEILAAPEDREHVSAILDGWIFQRAILHTLASPASLKRVRVENVRLMNPDEPVPGNVPEELAGELRIALRDSPVAAAYVGDLPVSFSYAGHVTETFWDISIDTLEGHRQRGLAMQCVVFLIDLFYERGLKPLWGSHEFNIASLRLAEKLGFQPVDELAIFLTPSTAEKWGLKF
jgi:GNAT superfamily N-acetyltransferase